MVIVVVIADKKNGGAKIEFLQRFIGQKSSLSRIGIDECDSSSIKSSILIIHVEEHGFLLEEISLLAQFKELSNTLVGSLERTCQLIQSQNQEGLSIFVEEKDIIKGAKRQPAKRKYHRTISKAKNIYELEIIQREREIKGIIFFGIDI